MDLWKYSSVSAAESEFMAEHEIIEIVPNFKWEDDSGKPVLLTFIMGDFGPFLPGIPVKVPLWMALQLKESNSCNITWPSWLQKEALEEALEEENSQQAFTPKLPYFYSEIFRLLKSSAPDNMGEAGKDFDEVKQLVEAIETKREGKLKSGMASVLRMAEGSGSGIQSSVGITNAGSVEVNFLREGFFKSMDLIADFNAMQRAINLRRDRTSRFQSKAVAGDADDYAGAGAGGGAGSGDGDGAGGADGDSGAAPAPRKINMREKLRARKKKRFSSDAGGIEGDDEDGGEAGQPADS